MKNDRRIIKITGIVLILAAVLLCPAVYYMNDDSAIRSILSGSYTGAPDGHAVYMKYPLTGLLSMLYRICGLIPWFDLMITGSMVLAAAMVLGRAAAITHCEWGGKRSFTVCDGGGKRSFLRSRGGLCLMVLLVFTLFFVHFLNPHYTILAAMLGGAAVFLVLTDGFRGEDTTADALKRAAVQTLLLVLCFEIRSQVFYLTLPFLAVALLWRLGDGKREARLLLLELLVCCTAVCIFWNGLMYNEFEWREYTEYNGARTELYDYAAVLPYEEYAGRYEELGISPGQYELLKRYGTALDNSITAETMRRTAQLYEEERIRQHSGKEYLKKCLTEYYYHAVHTDKPYNYLAAAGYLAVLLVCVFRKKLWRTALLFCMAGGRSLVWVYLIWNGRFPERIYVSLYLVELLALAGMLLWELRPAAGNTFPSGDGGVKRREGRLPAGVPGWLGRAGGFLLAALLLFTGVFQWQDGTDRWARQQERQREWSALRSYCGEHVEDTYLLNVDSMVTYAGKLYERLPRRKNYLLTGGWMSASPQLKSRYASLGVRDGGTALYFNHNVRFIAGAQEDVSWMEEYLTQRFGACSAVLEDIIRLDGRDIFAVYRFEADSK